MKQHSIVDIVVCLLETVASQQTDVEQSVVKQKLEEAGFKKHSIGQAFDWLKDLMEQQQWATSSNQVANNTLRIFNKEEMCRISTEVRSFILSMEHAGILDTKMREVVINQLMQLNQLTVDISDVKWVVLLVLMSKENKNLQEMQHYLLNTMAQD